MRTKTCARCGTEKPVSEFPLDPRRPGGFYAYCKPCKSEYMREHNRKRVEKIGPEGERRRNRSLNLRRKGLSEEAFDAMLAAQGGGCAICGSTQLSGKASRLQVDHDHGCCPEDHRACEKCIRGIVCGHCNFMLGRYGDDPAVFERAADYLRRIRHGT